MLGELERYTNIINGQLEQYAGLPEAPEKKVYEAMRYSLLAGGKRIRPVLTMAVNELFEGDANEAVPFACAVEMIHTYSLIHDDLPAMDNDDYRRGKPTNHKVFGQALAILAGDALLNKAFEIMISEVGKSSNHEEKVKAMKEIANAAGVEGMVAGQVVDLASEGIQIGEELLRYMHSRKTGRLIEAAAAAGGIIAGASQEDIKRIMSYASNLGLAFQIKDDILAETGNQDKMGKSVGNDRERNKSTYVTILGLGESERLLNLATQNAIDQLAFYGQKAGFLINLAKYLLQREN